MYLGWPEWRWVLVFIALLAGGWVLAWLRRRWLAWRLRRRLARPVGNSGAVDLKHVDKDWKAGIHTLKQSRLSRFGSPLYVLPWFLSLGNEASGKSDLLQRISGAAPVHAESDEPPALRWWLLRNGVVLDPADDLSDDNAIPGSQYWRRLLHWMMHTRRREPLNGVIATLGVEWLMLSDDTELAETGRRLRKRLDELTRIYDVRMPVYLVLTGCETFPGFRAWGESLDPELRNQPMGYLSADSQVSAAQFIAKAFASLVQRMLDLRILQGMRKLPDNTAFGLPERLNLLALRLDKVMHSAFQATPYAETPLLQGLFLTAKPGEASETGWFMPELFDRLLPMQRHAWKPIERWRHWRRLLRHAAVIAWLVVCVGVALVLIQGARVARHQLAGINDMAQSQFSGKLGPDLAVLQRTRDTILTLQERRDWKTRWLPFQRNVDTVENTLRAHYIDNFQKHIINAQLDPLLSTSLPLIPHEKNDLLLAAWAQTLVRRINLINGALQKQDISQLPAPGPELSEIYKSTGASAPSGVDIQMLGDLYRHFLAWQINPDLLAENRDALRHTLNGLELPDRPIQWIYSWVQLQGYLSPIRITDYWNIPQTSDQVEIPAALTSDGERAVSAFLAQIGSASGNTAVWEERHATFEQHYLQAGLKYWHEFVVNFPYAADRLPDENSRRAVLSALMGRNGPYSRLVSDLATVGSRVPQEKRPEWVRQVIHLENLVKLAEESPKTGLSGALQKASIVNGLGADVLQHLPKGGSLKSLDYLRNDQQSLDTLNAYHKGVQASITPLLQGQGTAMQAAVQIWSFGHDPNVKAVPLIDAKQSFDALRKQIGGVPDSSTDPIWKLMQGPLDFTLDYAGRSAACGLQSEWESSVVSAIQGVTDVGLINKLLYGDRGQVKAFLDGPIKNFVDRGTIRYTPRLAMGREIALNGQFYAFANHSQLSQVTLLVDQRKNESSQAKVAALTQQNAALEQQIAKQEATVASVALSTVPALVNPGARVLPQSVTLSVQCASKTLTLENLNFPNSAIFPWSLATCGDTVLTIQIGDLSLVKRWGGARGFIDFLREFSSGQHRYTPGDFPANAKSLNAANIKFILLTYSQQGQAPLLAAFQEADRLSAQLAQNKDQIAALDPPAGATAPPQASLLLPERIVSVCMGPVNAVAPVPAPAAPVEQIKPPQKPKPPLPGKPVRAALQPSGPESYSVQVGVFEHAEDVLKALDANHYKTMEAPIRLNGKEYTNVVVRGYKTRQEADAAAQKIGDLLKLKPQVIRHREP
ncbi:SPOR domain-containing protein [Paralcaligenes sp. KSB-10]|uniref:SPOR domain-containing protein n=1 Tax=Paralcaligenes sp. KSB-10 TaxID=2901142 RepID=UPI001E38BE1C|nr:SPOR domain-containing protein [Paralcaligenes sp. KSB-10]UHL65683.1 SPOR domain-containing protein [Paralcaligenes sp. KSB-10]